MHGGNKLVCSSPLRNAVVIAMQIILTFNRNLMPELRERFNPDCKYHFTRCGDGCVVDDVGISVRHHDVTFLFSVVWKIIVV